MELVLTRKTFTAKSTIGELTIDGKAECYVLEDHLPVPYKKTPGKTAIPSGRYEVKITFSPRFKVDMPLLLKVPGFEGVRIHTGNTAEHTEGCLIVGKKPLADRVEFSRVAYEALFTKLKTAAGPIWITIVDARTS